MEELEYNTYDPYMPCNIKKCDEGTRQSCCGCPEQLAWEKEQRNKNHNKEKEG